MKYEIEICLFRKIVMSLNARIIRKIAVIIIPDQINGTGLLTGANRITVFRMNNVNASANQLLYMMFMYSRYADFNPVTSARIIHVRCLSIRAARKIPVIIAVSFIESPGCLYLTVSVSSNETAAKRLTLSTVMRFLITGGHEMTPDVPWDGISGWRLKLSDASPEIMLFLPKTASTVISKRQTERRIKLKSALIFPGLRGWPSARLADK